MAKAKNNKGQHFVPRAYLTAWQDVTAKQGSNYVWIFRKDGTSGRSKDPKNLFKETDMYTITEPSGERNIELEQNLGELEKAFIAIRRDKLSKQLSLDDLEIKLLLCFAAAMRSRNPRDREHTRSQWGAALRMGEDLSKRMKNMTPVELKSMVDATQFGLPANKNQPGMTLEQLRKLVSHPLQETMTTSVSIQMEMLPSFDIAVLQTDTNAEFITSDDPCVWHDESLSQKWPYLALGSPTIEITLPLSPTQLLWLNRCDVKGYCNLAAEGVAMLNQRTRRYANTFVVTSKNHFNSAWLN